MVGKKQKQKILLNINVDDDKDLDDDDLDLLYRPDIVHLSVLFVIEKSQIFKLCKHKPIFLSERQHRKLYCTRA